MCGRRPCEHVEEVAMSEITESSPSEGASCMRCQMCDNLAAIG